MCKCQPRGGAVAVLATLSDEEPTGGDVLPRLSKQVQLLLDELSPKELEWAARSNYQYYRYFTQSPPSNNDDDDDNDNNDDDDDEHDDRAMTMAAAAAMARRYLASKSSPERALKGMRATLAFRAGRHVDANRTITGLSVTLRQHLSHGCAYVTGRDRVGRATLVFTPRLVLDHGTSEEGLLWTMERAIACSRHNDEINALVDFAGFVMWKHTPPMAVGKAILTLLRNYYVGHVHQILFLNAPASVNYVWNMFQPFAGQSTKDKISFVKSNKDLTKLYHPDQLPVSIMETGTYPEFHPIAYFAAKYDCLQVEGNY